MAVSENDLVVGPLTPAAGVTTISLDFYFEQAAWLEVYKTGSETPLVLNTHYTVTGAGSSSGVVTLTTPANGTDAYSVYLVVPLQRSSDMQLRGEFKSDPFNVEMDRIWQAMQGLRESQMHNFGVGKTDRHPNSITPVANRLLGFGDSGQLQVYTFSPFSTDAGAVVDYASVAALKASSEGARGEGQIWQAAGHFYIEAAPSATDHHIATAGGAKLYLLPGDRGYNILGLGAKQDASEDVLSILQTLTDASDDIPVYVPTGKYLWTDGALDITARKSFMLIGDNGQGYEHRSVFYCHDNATYNIDLPASGSFNCPVTIEGVTFDGKNGVTDNFSTTWPGAVRSQRAGGPWRFRMRKCTVDGSAVVGAVALDLKTWWWVEIDDCELVRFPNGRLLRHEGSTTFNVRKVYFHYAQEIMSLKGVSSFKFEECAFEAAITVGYFGGCFVEFNNCHWEHIGYDIAGSRAEGISDQNEISATGNAVNTWFNLVRANVTINGGLIYHSWPNSLAGIFRLIPYNTPGTYQRGGFLRLNNPQIQWNHGTVSNPYANLIIEDPTDTDGRGNKFTIEMDLPRADNDSSNYPFILTDANLRKLDRGQTVLHYSSGNMQRRADVVNGLLRIHADTRQYAGTKSKAPILTALAVGDEIINMDGTGLEAGARVVKAASTTLSVAMDLSVNTTIAVASASGFAVGDYINISDPATLTNHVATTITAVNVPLSQITVAATSGVAANGSKVVAHLVQPFDRAGRYIGTAAPTLGLWYQGDVVWNSAPVIGGVLGWVCTSAGTPGTWKPFGSVQLASAYTASNLTTDRSYDADTVAVAELADIVGTLIADLKQTGILP